MAFDPPLPVTPPDRDVGLLSRAGVALLLAVLATATEVLALFWAVLSRAFDHGWGFDGRLLPLLLAVGILAAAVSAIINGLRAGEHGRLLGWGLAALAVPFAAAGVVALYVVVAAY